MNEFTPILVHYYKERRSYIPSILASLENPLVWNNSDVPLNGAINAGKNFGAGAKFPLMALCGTEFILLQDDDLIIPPKTQKALLEFNRANPYSIVGIFGRQISNTPTPYTDSISVKDVSEPTACNMILGQVMMFRREILPIFFASLWAKRYDETDQMTSFDDILISLANEQAGNQNWIIPGEVTLLDEKGVGMSHHPDHLARRDEMCRRMYA